MARRMAHGGGHTGWSRAWLISMFARLGDGAGEDYASASTVPDARVDFSLAKVVDDPNPAVGSDVVMVGDSDGDLRCAEEVGCRFLWAGWNERVRQRRPGGHVLAEPAARIVTGLRRNLADGAYDDITDPREFADRLYEDAQAINHDGHFGIEALPPPDPEVLAAGLDGIENKIDPGEPAPEDVYGSDPGTFNNVTFWLQDALEDFKADTVLCEALTYPGLKRIARSLDLHLVGVEAAAVMPGVEGVEQLDPVRLVRRAHVLQDDDRRVALGA